MRCDRCGEDRALEDFEVGLMRPPLHSHEMQALDRLRREPAMVCRGCFRPSAAVGVADLLLTGEHERADPMLDLLADAWDGLRRRFGRAR